jgi:hypothetical protein
MEDLPSFKTRTIHYDEEDIKFWIFEDPGREYGTSTSLDGCYIASPAFPIGVTVAFPLELDRDLPKFYLNFLGQAKFYLNFLGQELKGRYMLDSPAFIREVEVKYPYKLPLDKALWAVLHVDEQQIKRDLSKQLEFYEKHGLESLISRTKGYAEIALDFIQNVRNEFTVIPTIPETSFRKAAIPLVQQVYDLYKTLGIKHFQREVTYLEMFDQLEHAARPFHKRIAQIYQLDYDIITQEVLDQLSKIKE